MQWSCSSLVLVKSEAHYDDVQYHYMARMNIYYTFSNTLTRLSDILQLIS